MYEYFNEPKRRSIALMVADGHSNAEIGRRVGMTEEAVKQITKRMRDKIGAANRVMLANWVRENIGGAER